MAKPTNWNKFSKYLSKHKYIPLLAAIELAFLIAFWVAVDYIVVVAVPPSGSPLMATYNYALIPATIFAIIILGLAIWENNLPLVVFAVLDTLLVVGASFAALAFNSSAFNNFVYGEVADAGNIIAMAFTWLIFFYSIRK